MLLRSWQDLPSDDADIITTDAQICPLCWVDNEAATATATATAVAAPVGLIVGVAVAVPAAVAAVIGGALAIAWVRARRAKKGGVVNYSDNDQLEPNDGL